MGKEAKLWRLGDTEFEVYKESDRRPKIQMFPWCKFNYFEEFTLAEVGGILVVGRSLFFCTILGSS